MTKTEQLSNHLFFGDLNAVTDAHLAFKVNFMQGVATTDTLIGKVSKIFQTINIINKDTIAGTVQEKETSPEM